MTSLARIRPSSAPRRLRGRARRPDGPRDRGRRRPRPRRQEAQGQGPGRHPSHADAGRDRAEARDPRPLLPPRPQQEHRGVQAHRRQGDLRQGRRRHDEAAAPHGARQAQVGAAHPRRRSGARPASGCACSRGSSASASRRPRARPSSGPSCRRPRPRSHPRRADGDCDGDGVKNGAETDDDSDLLTDTTELRYKTDPCKADSDGDGVTDGYEIQSATDLNDDEYQIAQTVLPYPEKRPYPNAAVRGRRRRLRRRLADAGRGVLALAGLRVTTRASIR